MLRVNKNQAKLSFSFSCSLHEENVLGQSSDLLDYISYEIIHLISRFMHLINDDFKPPHQQPPDFNKNNF